MSGRDEYEVVAALKSDMHCCCYLCFVGCIGTRNMLVHFPVCCKQVHCVKAFSVAAF